jgi:predicted 3-demethylubiquinone-9 3-methyltransferase (glyoxalase superfamily)
MASSPQKITPFLWFDNSAEAAMNHYVSIFKNSKTLGLTRNGQGGPGPEGSVLVCSFELDGVQFNALNGGPMFKFTEAISMLVTCDSQDEVDHFWDRLCEGGAPIQCGWLKDKFGLSWQIVPRVFFELIQDPDPAKSQRVMQAMMQMTKFDIAALQRAHRGE